MENPNSYDHWTVLNLLFISTHTCNRQYYFNTHHIKLYFLCHATKSGAVSCYTVRNFRCPSVRSSICPYCQCSIISCPLHNWYRWDIFTKLHTNIKHHETICRTHEPNTGLLSFGVITLWTLKIAISTMYLCPLHKSDTVRDSFTKLHIKYKAPWRAQRMNRNSDLSSLELLPFEHWT